MPDPVWQIAPDEISVPIAKLSLDGKWLAANHGLCDWLGSTFAEVSKIPFEALFVPRNPSEQQNLRSQLLPGAIAHYSSEGSTTLNGGKILPVRIDFCLTSDKQ